MAPCAHLGLPSSASLLSLWEGGCCGKRAPGAVPQAQTHWGHEMSWGLSSVRSDLFLAPLDIKEDYVSSLAAPFLHPVPVSCPTFHPGDWDDFFLGVTRLGLLQ